jgi:chromatin remodeling complex protein RSC6
MILLSELSVIVGTLQELERMHQLNLELLEQLDVVFKWIIETDMPIPNKEKLSSLFSRTNALLKELYSSSPQTMIYQKLADEKKQHPRTDGEVPVPCMILQAFCIWDDLSRSPAC